MDAAPLIDESTNSVKFAGRDSSEAASTNGNLRSRASSCTAAFSRLLEPKSVNHLPPACFIPRVRAEQPRRPVRKYLAHCPFFELRGRKPRDLVHRHCIAVADRTVLRNAVQPAIFQYKLPAQREFRTEDEIGLAGWSCHAPSSRSETNRNVSMNGATVVVKKYQTVSISTGVVSTSRTPSARLATVSTWSGNRVKRSKSTRRASELSGRRKVSPCQSIKHG